jgi:NAD/NADP transhydrogenase alpha subunit
MNIMYTIFNVSTLFVGEKEHFNINLEDEVVRGSIVVHNVS